MKTIMKMCSLSKEPIIESSQPRIDFVRYVAEVFNSPVDFVNDIPASAIIYSGLKKTKYLKSTGKMRYTKQLADDMMAYYTNLELGDIANMAQLQKVMVGDRTEFSVICQIAFYLGMDIAELVKPTLTKDELDEEYDSHYMKNRPKVDWASYDAEIAPLLNKMANSIYTGEYDGSGKPGRASEKLLCREMNIPGHRLENMPKCRAVLQKYAESFEEYWARRVLWAYSKLMKEDRPFYWSDIRVLAGVKKKHIDEIAPYLYMHGGKQIGDDILRLVR